MLGTRSRSRTSARAWATRIFVMGGVGAVPQSIVDEAVAAATS